MDARLQQAGLTEKECRAAELYYAERCTQDEIAGALDMVRGSVCRVIARFKQKLVSCGIPEPKRIGDGIQDRPYPILVDPMLLDNFPLGGAGTQLELETAHWRGRMRRARTFNFHRG